MKFSILFFFNITTFLLHQPYTAESKLLMSVILNGGKLPTDEGYTCNASDSQLIKNAIGAEDDDDRRLRNYPKKCKDQCRLYDPGSCHVSGCFGYRRRTQEGDKRAKRLLANRRLDDDEAICANGLVTLNAELDNILPQLSTGCRSLVQYKRAVSCFDDVRFAAVDSFTMWNADNDTIVQTNIQNNTVFCLSNNTMNIEAVANACVEEMDISIKGPVSRSREIESLAPYSIFGNNGDNFSGRKLPVGTYTVQTTLEGSLTPKSKVTFVVKKCETR